MSLLTTFGTEMPLDALSVELKRRIEARGLGPPRSFVKWAEQILVDHPERKALVLPAGTRIEGDAKLDGDDLLERGIATVAVLGDLEIVGRLSNADSEGGPFLFVDGDLRAGEIVKGGSSIIVLGSVASRGLMICNSSIGAFLAAGDLIGFRHYPLRSGFACRWYDHRPDHQRGTWQHARQLGAGSVRGTRRPGRRIRRRRPHSRALGSWVADLEGVKGGAQNPT